MDQVVVRPTEQRTIHLIFHTIWPCPWLFPLFSYRRPDTIKKTRALISSQSVYDAEMWFLSSMKQEYERSGLFMNQITYSRAFD